MEKDKDIKKDRKDESSDKNAGSDLCCCYVMDPCGCYVNPCWPYTDPFNCR